MINKLILAAFVLFTTGVFAQKTVVVTNKSAFDRRAEVVEVKACAKKQPLLASPFVLKNDKGVEVAYQLIYNNLKQISGFLFQADVTANATAIYTLSAGTPSPVMNLTSVQFVPERKDDFAWENDLAAYRMYGPALAPENPSNGVDLWLKRVSHTVVAKRYTDELKNGLTYHVDRGNGLDCYKVAHTLGAGGITPYADGKLWVGDNYNRYKILEQGPLRSVFSLSYDKVKVGNDTLKQEIVITVTAGAALNKAVVSYTGKAKLKNVAGGIFTHDGKGVVYSKPENGIIAYAEDAVSDAKENVGRNYVGVFMPCKVVEAKQHDNHLLLTAAYKTGKTYTYYFGGGWSKWQFPTDQHWFDAVEKFAKQVREPLQVKFK